MQCVVSANHCQWSFVWMGGQHVVVLTPIKVQSCFSVTYTYQISNLKIWRRFTRPTLLCIIAWNNDCKERWEGVGTWWKLCFPFHHGIVANISSYSQDLEFDNLPQCSSLWPPHWLRRGVADQWGRHTARFRQMLQTKRTGIVPQSSTEHTATASAYLSQRVECDWPNFHIVIAHTPLINVKFSTLVLWIIVFRCTPAT